MRHGARILLGGLAGSLLAALLAAAPALGAGELKFASTPALPTLPGVTLNAKSQIVSTTMTNISISDTTLSKAGWNVAVQGQSGGVHSAVFAQYCPKAKCGAQSEGYIAGGSKMAANSLTFNSTGASFTGGGGGAPTFQCASSCNIDSTSAVKIASAATGGAGALTWTSTGLSPTSLKLAVPTTLKALPSEDVYRVNILWTLSTGP